MIVSERAGSGHRRYPRPVLRRIAFIVFAQRVGLSLDEIASELARLPRDRAPGRRDWSRLSSGWAARIDERRASRSSSNGPITRGMPPSRRTRAASIGELASAIFEPTGV